MDRRARAVRLLRQHDSLSRGQLASLIEMSKGTTAALVTELLQSGVAVEARGRPGGPGAGRGRPSALLSLGTPPGCLVGVDFGHRHVRVAVADRRLRILAERDAALDVDRLPAEALDLAGLLLSEVLSDAGAARAQVCACAAGIPAPLDRSGRVVRSPSILAAWSGLDLHHELTLRTQLSFVVDNDANLGALGEATCGVARGVADAVYIKASNGLGVGIIAEGRVYRGSRGGAGEIGHIQLDPGGAWCRCGNRGCLETVVSAESVRQQLLFLGSDPASKPVAAKILAESGRTIGLALANICSILDPAMLVVGGDLASMGHAFIAGIRDTVARLAQPETEAGLQIELSQHGVRAELVGALCAAANNAELALA